MTAQTLEAPADTPMYQLIADPALGMLADILDDFEESRKANNSRLGQMTRSTADSDGRFRGLGLEETAPEVQGLRSLLGSLDGLEHKAIKSLEKRIKINPLGPWIKEQKGLGFKQAARLLAVIGDPYLRMWVDDDGELQYAPRTVGQLRAYCGHGDPSLVRRKGMTRAEVFQMGNPTAKMRLWNISQSLVKQGVRKLEDAPTEFSPETRTAVSPWGQVYLDRRAATADRLHSAECRRCGPSGTPAQPGSPWSAAHKQADALRVVGKEVLKGLWLEARRIHEVTD